MVPQASQAESLTLVTAMPRRCFDIQFLVHLTHDGCNLGLAVVNASAGKAIGSGCNDRLRTANDQQAIAARDNGDDSAFGESGCLHSRYRL